MTGLMPDSVTQPLGNRSRLVTWMTLMRPSWRMSRQPGMTAPTCAALRCIMRAGNAESSVPASGAPRQSTLASAVTAAALSLVRMSVMTSATSAQTPASQANCCWFLSLVPGAALLAKKLRKICVGRLMSTLGCGSARPAVMARSAPASFKR